MYNEQHFYRRHSLTFSFIQPPNYPSVNFQPPPQPNSTHNRLPINFRPRQDNYFVGQPSSAYERYIYHQPDNPSLCNMFNSPHQQHLNQNIHPLPRNILPNYPSVNFQPPPQPNSTPNCLLKDPETSFRQDASESSDLAHKKFDIQKLNSKEGIFKITSYGHFFMGGLMHQYFEYHNGHRLFNLSYLNHTFQGFDSRASNILRYV